MSRLQLWFWLWRWFRNTVEKLSVRQSPLLWGWPGVYNKTGGMASNILSGLPRKVDSFSLRFVFLFFCFPTSRSIDIRFRTMNASKEKMLQMGLIYTEEPSLSHSSVCSKYRNKQPFKLIPKKMVKQHTKEDHLWICLWPSLLIRLVYCRLTFA